MPKLEPVGRIDPDDLNLDPVIIPVAAYRIDTHEEVIEEFSFKPTMPTGTLALIERLGGQLRLDPAGGTDGAVNPVLVCLKNCMVGDDERARWNEFLDNESLSIRVETLIDLTRVLVEYYGRRPTQPSSGSSRTGRRGGRTSKGRATSAA